MRTLGAVVGQSISPSYSYITFKKVRVSPNEMFRYRYGGRAVNKKLSFTVEVRQNWRGEKVFTFRIDELGWYCDVSTTRRLQQLAASDVPVALVNNSKEYLLQPEDRGPFSVWLDQLIEQGLLPTRYTDEGKLEGIMQDDALVLTEGPDYELSIKNTDDMGWLGIGNGPSQLTLRSANMRTGSTLFYATLDGVTRRPRLNIRGQPITPRFDQRTGQMVDFMPSAASLLGQRPSAYGDRKRRSDWSQYIDWLTHAEVTVSLTDEGRQQLLVFMDMLMERGL